VHQWWTDACRLMRDPPAPKFTKFTEQVSIGRPLNVTNFVALAKTTRPRLSVSQIWSLLTTRLRDIFCPILLISLKAWPTDVTDKKLKKGKRYVSTYHAETISKVKPQICIAFYTWYSSLTCSGMARVNDGWHSFTCHPHVYSQVEWAIPVFTVQPQSITALWPASFSSLLGVGGWVGLGGWLHTKTIHPQQFTNSTTNWDTWRATLLTYRTLIKLPSKQCTHYNGMPRWRAYRLQWRHTNLWSHYDLYVVRQQGMLCKLSGEDLSSYSDKIE